MTHRLCHGDHQRDSGALIQQYGNLTPQDLADNDARLKQEYDPGQPIELLFDQVEDAVGFADTAKAPYTPEQIVAITFNLVFKTGMFQEACRDWKRRPAVE